MNIKCMASMRRIAETAVRIAFFAVMLASAAALAITLASSDEWLRTGIAVALGGVSLGCAMSAFLGAKVGRDQKRLAAIVKESARTHFRVNELFAMTDMLQAAEEHEDAGVILMTTSLRLLPDYGGALYVFNNSRDRLDLAKSWNLCDAFAPPANILPARCWALKRGKPHINDPGTGTLCCAHHETQVATVEVPMMARGSVYGLLVLATNDGEAFDRLMQVRRLGRALADSMSLALSNIALREKLRTQSLRDPLTGLYNRRYMEDALERYVSLAERTGDATSVVMIDLDNFKNLNDERGHAKGDVILREVATQLVGALRPSDVVCRYGGEELLVIMPNCGLDDAQVKAETLRARVEALSEAHGFAISGSFGVASIPETAEGLADVVAKADAALYQAKQQGKNCVRAADRQLVARKSPAHREPVH